LLKALPVDTGVAFVVIQHLDPKHENLLREILATATRISVREITNGMLVGPNTVYVMPANTGVTLSQRAFELTVRKAEAQSPIAELLAKLTVLLAKVVNDLQLALIHPSGNGD
jgi:chemotaxis response regulator CheB